MPFRAEIDEITPAVARQLHNNHMEQLGIGNTMSLAHAYNQRRFGRQDQWRREMHRNHLDRLLADNGPQKCPSIEMHDGWAIDTSMTLPFLDRVLEDSNEIITGRSGVRNSAAGAYRSYFQDVWQPEDATRYPSFLDFATSTDVLATVSRYLQCIPVLSTTLPAGIRFVESSAAFDDQPDCPHDSQLYHIDYYSLPNVYVLVLLRDTTRAHGPWTFIPRARSQVVKAKLGYGKQGRGYRLSDEEVYSVVDPGEVIEFTYPRGTVLFIESSGCFHFGSRNAVQPRFQLMYGYSGAIRTDFSEVFMSLKEYPVRESDPLLRKMVLNQRMLPSR
jgi:hypothetical protein